MEITVGVDVSKDRLDVHVHPAGEVFAVSNDDAGVAELCCRLEACKCDAIGLEASGGYERLAVGALAAAGLPVVVLNPMQVRAYAKALGQKAKTDPIDAAVIARFIAATQPELRPLPDAETIQLSELIARRRQLVAMLVAERQRRSLARPGRARVSMARIVTALEDELRDLDGDLDKTIRGTPA